MIVQGDVFLVKGKIPKGASKKTATKRGLVLAEGEATGHAHCITESAAELYEHNGILYLRASVPVSLKHEEHRPVTISIGDWQVGIVQEYDPFEQEARNVRD